MAKNEVKILITGDASKFTKATKDAETALTGVEQSGKKTSTMSSGMSTALLAGGAAAVAFGKKSMDAYMGAGKEVLKLSRLTGGTAEDMSRLRVVAQQSGVEFGTLTKSITMFSKGLQSGGGPAKALDQLGVSAKTASGATRPYTAILTDLAAKFEKMPDGIEKNALAMQLFGKSGADMVPLLNKGKDGIAELSKKADELGLTFKNTDGIKEQIKAQRDLSLAWQGIQVQVGSVVAPAMLKFSTVMAEGAKTAGAAFAHVPEPIREVGTAIAGLTGAAALVGGAWAKVRSGISNIPGIDKLRSQFVTLGDDGEKSFTRLGRAAVVAGKVLAAAGISEAIFGILNSARGMDGQMTDAINKTIIAAGKGGKDVVSKFAESVNVEGSKLSLAGLWERFGTQFRIGGQGVVADIEHIQRAFDDLMKTDPAGAQALIDKVKDLDQGLDKNSTDYVESEKIVKKWQSSLDAAGGAAKALKGDTDDSTDSLGDNTAGVKENEQAWKDLADRQRAATDPLFGVLNGMDRVSDAQKSVNDAVAQYGPKSDEARQATLSLAAASGDLDGALFALKGSGLGTNEMLSQAGTLLMQWVANGRLTAAQAKVVMDNFKLAAGAANSIPTTRTTTLMVNDAEARAKLDAFLNKVKSVGLFNAVFTPKVNLPAAAAPKKAGKTPDGWTGAVGGTVPGQGNTDSVPAMLMPGEFVVRKSVVQKVGTDAMHRLNSGQVQKFAKGGLVGKTPVSAEQMRWTLTMGAKQSTNLELIDRVDRLSKYIQDNQTIHHLDMPQFPKVPGFDIHGTPELRTLGWFYNGKLAALSPAEDAPPLSLADPVLQKPDGTLADLAGYLTRSGYELPAFHEGGTVKVRPGEGVARVKDGETVRTIDQELRVRQAVGAPPAVLAIEVNLTGNITTNDPLDLVDGFKKALENPTVQAEVRRHLGIYN